MEDPALVVGVVEAVRVLVAAVATVVAEEEDHPVVAIVVVMVAEVEDMADKE